MPGRKKELTTISELILYQAEDGKTNIEVRLQNETVWMSQLAMSELFQTTVPNINIHLNNVYDEEELSETATIKDYLIVRHEGSRQVRRTVRHYNLKSGTSINLPLIIIRLLRKRSNFSALSRTSCTLLFLVKPRQR